MNQPAHRDRIWAVRGAVPAARNDERSILEATEELIGELTRRNVIDVEHVVSVIFTCTPDLDAQFPAVAARRLGFERVPLICAREIPVPGAMPSVIRILMHYYGAAEHVPDHVYIGAAQKLRSDLDHAQ